MFAFFLYSHLVSFSIRSVFLVCEGNANFKLLTMTKLAESRVVTTICLREFGISSSTCTSTIFSSHKIFFSSLYARSLVDSFDLHVQYSSYVADYVWRNLMRMVFSKIRVIRTTHNCLVAAGSYTFLQPLLQLLTSGLDFLDLRSDDAYEAKQCWLGCFDWYKISSDM
jgi:hypothetical protein